MQGSYYLPPRDWMPEEGRLTLVWIPQYIPFRFPRLGERWFPPAAVPPDTFPCRRDLALPDGRPNPAFDVPLGLRVRQRLGRRRFRMDNAGYGARFSALAGGVDYALYYYHGFDAQPAFELTAEAFGERRRQAAVRARRHRRDAAAADLPPRRCLWGADAAFAWERLHAARRGGLHQRPALQPRPALRWSPIRASWRRRSRRDRGDFQRRGPQVPIDLGESFVERDAVDWGVGVDYQLAGYLLLLQVNQTDVLDNDVDLLIKDIETRLIANLRKTFLHDDLTLQLLGLHAIESDYTLAGAASHVPLWEGCRAARRLPLPRRPRSSTVGPVQAQRRGVLSPALSLLTAVGDGAVDLAAHLALADGVALVVVLLAARQAELDLGAAVLEVEPQRDQGQAAFP